MYKDNEMRLYDYLCKENYLKNYDIENDKIILHYFNGETKTLDKDQYSYYASLLMNDLYDFIDDNEYQEYIDMSHTTKTIIGSSFIGWSLYALISLIAKKPLLPSILPASVLGIFYIFESIIEKDIYQNYGLEDYFNKLKYFIDNEEIINMGIEKQFEDEYSNNMQELNYPTINDVSKMHIKELKEMVELISNAYPEEAKKLQMKRSY